MTRELYHPVLDCFLRGLPFLYRGIDAPQGTALLVAISGDCGGLWCLAKTETDWHFVGSGSERFAAHVEIPQQIAWRVFTKGIDRESAKAQIRMGGDRDLAGRVLALTSIVA